MYCPKDQVWYDNQRYAGQQHPSPPSDYSPNAHISQYEGKQHPSPPSDYSSNTQYAIAQYEGNQQQFGTSPNTQYGIAQYEGNQQQFGTSPNNQYVIDQQPFDYTTQSHFSYSDPSYCYVNNNYSNVGYGLTSSYQSGIMHPQQQVPIVQEYSNVGYLMAVLNVSYFPDLQRLPIYAAAVSNKLEEQIWQVFGFMGHYLAMQHGIQTTNQIGSSPTGSKCKNNGGGLETVFTTLYKIFTEEYGMKCPEKGDKTSQSNNPARTLDKNPKIKELTSDEKLNKTVELTRKVCLLTDQVNKDDLINLELLFHLQIGCKAASKSRTSKEQFVCDVLNELERIKEEVNKHCPRLNYMFEVPHFKTSDKLPFRNVQKKHTLSSNKGGQQILKAKWVVDQHKKAAKHTKTAVKQNKRSKSKRKTLQQNVNDQSFMGPVASTSCTVQYNQQGLANQSWSNQYFYN